MHVLRESNGRVGGANGTAARMAIKRDNFDLTNDEGRHTLRYGLSFLGAISLGGWARRICLS